MWTHIHTHSFPSNKCAERWGPWPLTRHLGSSCQCPCLRVCHSQSLALISVSSVSQPAESMGSMPCCPGSYGTWGSRTSEPLGLAARGSLPEGQQPDLQVDRTLLSPTVSHIEPAGARYTTAVGSTNSKHFAWSFCWRSGGGHPLLTVNPAPALLCDGVE